MKVNYGKSVQYLMAVALIVSSIVMAFYQVLDISDESQEDFDELIIERSAKSVWVHFAVRPSENRRKVDFIKK